MPDDLVEVLRQQHTVLIRLAEQIRAEKITFERPNPLASEYRARLLEHLQLEETRFYPVLERAAREDRRIQRMLAVFGADYAQLTKTTRRFFSLVTQTRAQAPNVNYQALLQDLGTNIWSADDKDEIASLVTSFFDDHPEIWVASTLPVKADWLMVSMHHRMEREENVLFPLYQKLRSEDG